MHLRTLTLLATGLTMAATALPAAAAAPYAEGRDAFSFRDGRISEASGVVASAQHDAAWFVHNDSGHPGEVFTVDDHGCTLSVTSLVDDTGTDLVVTDVEDIARGPHDGDSVLWLGDIGDNFRRREVIQVYRVPEPRTNSSGERTNNDCGSAAEAELTPTTYVLDYGSQAYDAETLLADPETGQLFVVTKSATNTALVYAAPLVLDPDGVNQLERVAEIVFPVSTTYDRDEPSEILAQSLPFDIAGRLSATGGDIAPARDRVVVRTYTDAFEWTIPVGASLAEALTADPVQIPLVWERQGEAIAYTRDGRSLLTVCEDDPDLPEDCTAHLYEGS